MRGIFRNRNRNENRVVYGCLVCMIMGRELNVEGRGPDIQIWGSSSWYSGSEIRVNEGSSISRNDGIAGCNESHQGMVDL